MKNAIFSALIISLVSASISFAASYTSGEGAKISGVNAAGTAKQMGQLSNKVTLKANYDLTSFAAATTHLNGTKEFGSSSGDTKIFQKDKSSPSAAAPADLSASDSSNFTSWTSM